MSDADAAPQQEEKEGGGAEMLRVVVEGCCHGELDQVGG